MWFCFALLLLVGAAAAEHDHAWKTGNEYHYLIRSRTLTSLDKLSEQFSGIVMKGVLTVQVKSPDTLQAAIYKPQYARVHTILPTGWDSRLPDDLVEIRELPLSGKPFELKIKHGLIRDVVVEKDVPTWEVNLLKSLASQLQIDTNGENAMRSKGTQVPEDEQPFAMFRAMEDSVGGQCEVLYDITPLPEHVIQRRPELVPFPDLRGNGHHMDIMKTKNYSRCEQRMGYHFGVTGQTNWEPGSNDNGRFLSKSGMSRVIISGNMKRFTIQSSVTTNKVFVSARVHDYHSGTVYSRMNLTLARIDTVTKPLPSLENPQSTGNLVYQYNSPFPDSQPAQYYPTISRDSRGVHYGSASSSEEKYQNKPDYYDNNYSASSSSISSSEEHNYWQAKPTLDEAPHTPLMPFFIGYMGRNIQVSDKIDLVTGAKGLINQIAEELENPNDMISHDTTDKFIIISSLIRLMNTKQITELENSLDLSRNRVKDNNKKTIKEENAWDVLTDAVTQAGTGPALRTIINWIEDRKVEGLYASRIVSRLPRTARVPTAEYVHAFFEMMTKPEVMRQKFLNETAPMVFSQLVRSSQISNTTLHNRYPVHSFGRMASKHDQTVLQTYIPYMANQLRKAIKEGDSPRIQTYIVALASFGHPKILSVFEPYLEGLIHISNYQRMMMVTALTKLTETAPRVSRSVLYKIYLNPMEAHEVRCMAVYLLMKTNPPLGMLQRMAEFTNYDYSRHVNSAVKSTLQSIARLKRAEWQDMANKARIAEKLLTKERYGSEYSQGLMTDSIILARSFAYKLVANTIGSDDIDIPKAMYVNVDTFYGGFHPPATEMEYMVSSMKQFINLMWDFPEKKHQKEKSTFDKIVQTMKIQPDDPQQLEGNFYIGTKYGLQFMPFDNHTIEWFSEKLLEYLRSLKEAQRINVNDMDSFDVTLGFPLETGLPFVYTLRAPRLGKMSGNQQVEVKYTKGYTIKAKAEIRMVLATKVQGRIGFVTPFEHQHYIAGIDNDMQTYLPLKYQLEMDSETRTVQIKTQPLVDDSEVRLVHYSVRPYTARQDVLNLQPLSLDKNTHIVHTKEVEKHSYTLPLNIINIKAEGDNFNSDVSAEENTHDYYDMYIKPWVQYDAHYAKLNVYLNTQVEYDWVTLSMAYDTAEVDADNAEHERTGTTRINIPEITDKQPVSQARRKQVIKEISKGINSATAYVVDIGLDIPGRLQNQVLTVGIADSNVDEKSRALMYWNVQSPKTEKIHYETLAIGQMRSSQNVLLDFDKAMKSEPRVEFNGEVRFGQNYVDGEVIKFKGKQTRNNEMREAILNSEIAKRCQKEMKEGNKGLRACQKANTLATTLNQFEMTLDFDSPAPATVLTQAMQYVGDNVDTQTNVEVLNPRNTNKNSVEARVKISPDLEMAEISVYTSEMDVTFPLEIPQTGLPLYEYEKDAIWEEENYEASCTMDKDRVVTFDDKTYPSYLGKCWHVLMTTYPQENPDNPNETMEVPEETKVLVLAREEDDGSKQARIIMDNKEVLLYQTNGKLQATVDKEEVKYSQYKSYVYKEDDETVIEIFELPDGSIRCLSEKYGVKVVYDGKRLRLEVSDEYRNALRGLCGNYDTQPENDFTTPKNCILENPEEFIATYAVTSNKCEGPVLTNRQRAEQSKCVYAKIQQSNVISDIEAGRIPNEYKKWGYHQGTKYNQDKHCHSYRTKVVEKEDELCFTNRPMPVCLETCKATGYRAKKYSLHCMPKNDATYQLKNRIEQGANPDMTRKSVTTTQTFEVPLACIAA